MLNLPAPEGHFQGMILNSASTISGSTSSIAGRPKASAAKNANKTIAAKNFIVFQLDFASMLH